MEIQKRLDECARGALEKTVRNDWLESTKDNNTSNCSLGPKNCCPRFSCAPANARSSSQSLSTSILSRLLLFHAHGPEDTGNHKVPITRQGP